MGTKKIIDPIQSICNTHPQLSSVKDSLWISIIYLKKLLLYYVATCCKSIRVAVQLAQLVYLSFSRNSSFGIFFSVYSKTNDPIAIKFYIFCIYIVICTGGSVF